MKPKYLYLSFLLIGLLMGCNCHHDAKGTVFDAITSQPLAGVTVNVYVPGKMDEFVIYKVETDEKGQFDFSHDQCTDYDLEFTKEGYTSFIAKRESQMEILLEKK